MLTDEWNFSVSNAVTYVVKQTNFATIVGTQTFGGGFGMAPTIFTLPNTGIAIRYTPVYTVDEKGRNDYEHGAVPHVFNFEDMDALGNCPCYNKR